MPGVLFSLPKQNPQQGPTCWYYSLKVIMKYHGLLSAPGPAHVGPNLHAQWKALHRIRQSITGLKAGGAANYDAPAALRARLMATIDASVPETPIWKQSKQAHQALEGREDNERMNFVDCTLGMNHIVTTRIDPWSIDGVMTTLRTAGPFYISVDKAPHGNSIAQNDPYIHKETYRVKGDHFSGGAHAMVIFGAYRAAQGAHFSPDKERVYFWNPNDPASIYYAAWDDIKEHLNTPAPFGGNIIGVGVTCNPGNRCGHINAAVNLP